MALARRLYGPAEQASLGALEAVLAKNCGHAFHRSMIPAAEPDTRMTYLFRGGVIGPGLPERPAPRRGNRRRLPA